VDSSVIFKLDVAALDIAHNGRAIILWHHAKNSETIVFPRIYDADEIPFAPE